MTPEQYLEALPVERRQALSNLRQVFRNKLPAGFAEVISNGMISYVVPHSLYPPGYHCNPKQPLPFISIASQKNYVAVYHLGIYCHPELLDWFKKEYTQQVKTKLCMGKSCIRFNKTDQIPYTLMGQLATKMTVPEWIGIYEALIKK